MGAALVNGTVLRVTSVAAIESLTGINGHQVQLSGLRGGPFRFNAQDLSTEVSYDTYQGIYIAPNSDLTGASGAWVRQFGQAVTRNGGAGNPLWFGAQASWDGIVNGGFDDTPYIDAALKSGLKEVEFLPSPYGGFYQMRESITVDATYPVETIKGAGGKIKVGNFISVSTGGRVSLFQIDKSDTVVDGLSIDLNGLKNYDDQAGVLYYKWGPNSIRQAGAISVTSNGTNTDNVTIRNCNLRDGDSAISISGNSFSGNPEGAASKADLVTNTKVYGNFIELDRGNAIYNGNGVLGVIIKNNTILNGFYVSIRCYNSVADATIINNTVIVNYNNMDPSTYETSTSTDFSQPTNPNVGPRCAGIWYAKGSAGVGDSLGNALIANNSITYVGYPAGTDKSEKWAAYNVNTKSLDIGAAVTVTGNQAINPIRSGFIARGVGDGTVSGSKTVISKNTVRMSLVHGIEIAVTSDVIASMNDVFGYDVANSGGNALKVRAASDCFLSNNYVSRDLSTTTDNHVSLDDSSSGSQVVETRYGEKVDFNEFTQRTGTTMVINPTTWTDVAGLDTAGNRLKFRLTVTNLTDGENQFASAIFVQDDVNGSGFVIGTVDADSSGIINLRVDAGSPQVFLTNISGSGVRRLSFDYYAL
jgi:hypothetical protein